MFSLSDYDADLYRDGYKMGRGGKLNRMFKGNERTNNYNSLTRRRHKSGKRSKRFQVKKEANQGSAEYLASGVRNCRGAQEEVSWKRNGWVYIDDDYKEFGYSGNNASSFIQKEYIAAKECQICCEIRPLVPLLKKCNHAPVCRECLREIYVNQAHQNVSNYPLQCYHPSCRKKVHDIHLIKHNLIHSETEFKKHYRLQTLGKAYKGSRDLVYCPKCEFPKIVNNRQNRVSCRQCKVTFEVVTDIRTSMQSTIDAIESLKGDKIGMNDGWTNCPKCKLLISKGNGCDHMTCVCGKSFSWTDALKRKPKILRHAAVKSKMVALPS